LKSTNIYTTVSKYVAKKGYSFKFLGAADECKTCPIMKVCLGKLEENELYSISEVGRRRLDCPLIGEDAVVVLIKKASRLLGVSSKSAIIGTTLRVPKGRDMKCNDRCLCYPDYINEDKKYVVLRVVKKTFDCPYESSRSLVEVQPV
jgi:uncharacterized protein (UPF0179 family)